MDAISALTGDTGTTPTTSADPIGQSLGKDTFLQLLVAQLKYQDPMSPADSQSFLAQTAQFTSVEKLEEIADSLAALTKSDQLATIGNLVGKQVQHRDGLGQLVESTVTAGRVGPDGIVLVLGTEEIGIDDVEAVLAPPVAGSPPAT